MCECQGNPLARVTLALGLPYLLVNRALVQYRSKATDTVCSIKLKREEFLYIRTIFNFQAEFVLIYMLLFYQISAWVFLIHMFLYTDFYCLYSWSGISISSLGVFSW